MANFKMTNWRVKDTYPYYMLGSAGENNATQIIITVDELIENSKYYLDIGDENGSGLPNTQELTPNTSVGTNGESIYTLSMKPLTSWLGREGVKLLQVRCVYFDTVQIVKESNVFHGTVDRNSGFIYRYNIAIFEQYLEKIRNGNGDKVSQEQLNELLEKQHVVTVMPPAESYIATNQVYQYIGETTTNFQQGHYYKSVWDEMSSSYVWKLYNFSQWIDQWFDEDNNNFPLNPYDYYHNVSSFDKDINFVIQSTLWQNYYDEAKIEIDNNYDSNISFTIEYNPSLTITVPTQANKRYVLVYSYCDGFPKVKVESNFITS